MIFYCSALYAAYGFDTKRDYSITTFSGWLDLVIEPAVSMGLVKLNFKILQK